MSGSNCLVESGPAAHDCDDDCFEVVYQYTMCCVPDYYQLLYCYTMRHALPRVTVMMIRLRSCTNTLYVVSPTMTKCVKPLRHLAKSSTKLSRSTNQNAPFGRLSTTCC